MSDDLPQVHFNDGEGLDEGDLNRLQTLSAARNLEQSIRLGSIGNAMDLQHATGGDPRGGTAQTGGLSALGSEIVTPDPFSLAVTTFEVSGAGELTLEAGSQLIVQRRAGNAAGTAPAGWDEGQSGGVMAVALDDDVLNIAGVAAPAANPRWDSLNISLDHATGNPVTRDIEDASTRAPTTAIVDKDQNQIFSQEVQSGAESATPTYPTPTSRFGRYLTVLRDVGETALDSDETNVRLHTFPTKLRIERVYARDALASTPGDWTLAASNAFGLERANSTATGALNFYSKMMHAGCRLVAVGLSTYGFTNNLDGVRIIRSRDSSVTPGFAVTSLALVNLASLLTTSDDGYSLAGLADFVDGDGNDLPIWGNGTTHGPLLSRNNLAPMKGGGSDGIVLTISDSAGPVWTVGDSVNYIEFFYLE